MYLQRERKNILPRERQISDVGLIVSLSVRSRIMRNDQIDSHQTLIAAWSSDSVLIFISGLSLQVLENILSRRRM